MKKIIWIATGGTICCIDGENGLSPAASETQMKNMLEASSISADTEINCLMNIDSTDISFEDMARIGNAVNEAVSKGYSGIVITHGTDTMAYTAAFLNKMLENLPIPVIITGAQRPFFSSGSDGVSNLKNAFAAAEDNRFRGVHLLFGSKLIKGGNAHKEYTHRDDAFISNDTYTAEIIDGAFTKININAPKGSYHFNNNFCSRIKLIKITPFTEACEFEGFSLSECKGLVIEGYGAGGIPSRLLDPISKLISSGVKVMLISQCFYEGIDMDIYKVGKDAAGIGVISGGSMCAEAAVMHLSFSI